MIRNAKRTTPRRRSRVGNKTDAGLGIAHLEGREGGKGIAAGVHSAPIGSRTLTYSPELLSCARFAQASSSLDTRYPTMASSDDPEDAGGPMRADVVAA